MKSASQGPVVLKFGGAALADGAGIRRVESILRLRGGERPIVVVSAAQGVTDLLVQVAQAAVDGRAELERVRIRHRMLLSQAGLDPELLNRLLSELGAVLDGIRARRAASPAERDFVLSFGERMSARVVAACLCAAGLAATPVDAFDLGLVSDSNHGRARPLAGTQAAIRRALEEVPGIAVVTGFVAKDASGNLTTLGRNGSDLSASLLAEAAGAREVQFWKDVRAVMTADPSLVPEARAVERLSYAEAAEYAHRGARVLHPEALAPLERAGLCARVLCFSHPNDEGTWIGAGAPAMRRAIGVTARRGFAWVRMEQGAGDHRAARAGELLAKLAQIDLEPAWVQFGALEWSFACAWSDALGELLAAQGTPCKVERGLAIAALVGADVAELESARRALHECGAEVRFHGGEPESRTALFAIPERDLEPSLRAMHAAVFEAVPLRARGG